MSSEIWGCIGCPRRRGASPRGAIRFFSRGTPWLRRSRQPGARTLSTLAGSRGVPLPLREIGCGGSASLEPCCALPGPTDRKATGGFAARPIGDSQVRWQPFAIDQNGNCLVFMALRKFGHSKETLRLTAPVPAAISRQFWPGRTHWPAAHLPFPLPDWHPRRRPTGGRVGRSSAAAKDVANPARRRGHGPTVATGREPFTPLARFSCFTPGRAHTRARGYG